MSTAGKSANRLRQRSARAIVAAASGFFRSPMRCPRSVRSSAASDGVMGGVRGAARRAPVLVLLAVADRPGRWDTGSPGPHRFDDLLAAPAPGRGPVVEVRDGEPPVPERDVEAVAALRNAEEHRVEVE